MPVYLIRHAHAGSRAGWGGDDDARPLSPKGRAQTTGLTTWLADQPVDEVRSSPSARCRQTVEPLAASHGLEVESDRTLSEGSDVEPSLATVLDASDRTLVLCSHGDLIPKLISRLIAMGMRTSGPNLSQKGSAWVLDIVDGEPVSGVYQPPFAKAD